MWHATKKIECDTHNEEYFESHYQFCQGFENNYHLDDDEDNKKYLAQTLLFSKCQKDPLSTDAEYKHRNVVLTVGGEYCARCKTKTPLSLKILSCNEILKCKEITMVGVSFLPRELITFLMEVGLNILKKDDWDVIKSSISVLLEYWPYKVLDLTTLTDKEWFQGALTRLVLDRFAAEIDSDALQKPCRNQLTEFVTKTSIETAESRFYHNLHHKLFSTVCSEKRRWVFDRVGPTRKYIITTDIYIRSVIELCRILYILRLCRKPGSPFEVRIINWYILIIYESSVLARISQEINAEIVKSLTVKVKPEDILKLDEILKPCVELTSLSLTLNLFETERNDALRQKLANDVSLLIGRHPTLKRLVLRSFEDLIVGYWDKYRLLTSLETLVLYNSILMRVDLEHWTNASTTSHIRHLAIVSYLTSDCPSEINGYLKFIESHAETLVSLDIHLYSREHQPTVDSLKRMAKRLAQYNKLKSFKYRVQNVHDLLLILLDVMPLIAVNQSLNNYNLCTFSCLLSYGRDFLQSLQLAMKEICIGRKGLLDFATVDFCVNKKCADGIPTVKYEELCEVIGYPCYLPDDYYYKGEIYEDRLTGWETFFQI